MTNALLEHDPDPVALGTHQRLRHHDRRRTPTRVPHHPALTDWQQRQLHGIEWLAARDRAANRRTHATIAIVAIGTYASAAAAAYAVVRR